MSPFCTFPKTTEHEAQLPKSLKIADHKSWTRQSQGATYVCSTDPSILDLRALNSALGSDMLWWASALPEDRLKIMIDNCLILALYQVEPESNEQPAQGKVVLRPENLVKRGKPTADTKRIIQQTPRGAP